MKLGFETNAWGGVVGHPAGVTSVKDLFYLAPGRTEEALQEISRAGYQGFELFDGNLVAYEDDKDSFRSLMRDTGLELVGVYAGANFIYPDIFDDELWRIEKGAALAAEFGAQHVVVGGGAVRASGIRDDDYARLAEGLDRVAALAEKYGLVASYHPHLGTCVTTLEQMDKVFPRTRINFCPDTAHIDAAGGNSAEVVRKYADRIRYIHLKDYLRHRDGNFLPLGEGTVDFEGVLDALRAHNFDGWITMEQDGYTGPATEGAIRSREYLEALLARQR
jgi:inosose dehydratase